MRQAISRLLACSFSLTIPEQKERLLVVYKKTDHQGYDVLIFGQILLTSSLESIWRAEWRISILIPMLKGLSRVHRKEVREGG